MVSGNDAKKFLQNLMTNDIELCKVDNEILKTPVYTLFLNPQGRILCDAFIVFHNWQYLLDVPSEYKDDLISHLKKYRLRAAVEIEETDYHSLYISKAGLGSLPSEIMCYYRDPRDEHLGYRCIASSYNEGLQERSYSAYLLDKYTYAIVDMRVDMISGKALAPEFGLLDKFNAVSYDKGCYLGQEFMSRTKHYGVVRKFIFVFRNAHTVEHANKGDTVTVALTDSTEITGTVTSVWREYIMALISMPDQELISQINKKTMDVVIGDNQYSCLIYR